MDYLSLIRKPIEDDLALFSQLFQESLSHTNGLLHDALMHIRNRGGKQMRPMLVLLMAKLHGGVNETALYGAVGLELLHTASLVHDDVVDESNERRGQKSVNAVFNNKVSILVGDYILSTALYYEALTCNHLIVRHLAQLGRALSNGEIDQLSNISDNTISEENYFEVIRQKTAALFACCARIGAIAAGATEEESEASARFGETLGMMFQIRDDIFDYYDSKEIGKPTGNDMAEGKLTLPVIYALNKGHNDEMLALARKVKAGKVNADEIANLVEYTKQCGGIEYAMRRMEDYREQCLDFIRTRKMDEGIKDALKAYIDYIIKRNN